MSIANKPLFNKTSVSLQKQILFVYIALAVVTLAVFWQANQYPFVHFDDDVYVTGNSFIQSGITSASFRWAFSTTYADFWHPLTWLSLMFDYQLHGLSAGGYHFTNLILHVLSALLLFWLFRRMTGSIWRSAFVAAFFALHPLHVESVAWVAERKDVLSAFFWMLTLCLYVYYTEKPAVSRYLLILFSFACGLMSKPMIVTLPVIMILLDYWPLGRLQSRKIMSDLPVNVAPVSAKQGKKKKLKKEELKKKIFPPNNQRSPEARIAGIIPLWQLWEKIPFFILSVIFSIITLYAQYKPNVKSFPLASRIANAPVSFVTYLEKTFWPHDLTFFYPFPSQIPLWQVLGAALLILIISAAVIATLKHLPYLFVGWLWYAITILPVIGIMQNVEFSMADRYTYLPSIGIAVMLAWGIPLIFSREDIRKNILFPAAIAFLMMLTILSWKQCAYWKNSIELFNHALQVTENNDTAHNNLASVLLEEGKIEEALQHYNEAIRIKSDDAYCYYNRGLAYFRSGRPQLAVEDYSKAILLKPDFADAFNSRGLAYGKLGQSRAAIEDFSKSINLTQDYTIAYINRGIAYLNQRNMDSGCSDVQKACELGNCAIFEEAKRRGDCR
jgi:protein O-mannosyl-transferase